MKLTKEQILTALNKGKVSYRTMGGQMTPIQARKYLLKYEREKMSRDTKKIASPWKFSENDLWDLSKEQEASFDAALRKSIEETSKWIRGMKAERIQSARHVKQMRFGHSRDQ